MLPTEFLMTAVSENHSTRKRALSPAVGYIHLPFSRTPSTYIAGVTESLRARTQDQL